jgi:hypothetical protein
MASPPKFVKGESDVDAVSEYRKFVDAVGEPAAHLLAELAEIHNYGSLSDIPAEDSAKTSARGLYCRCIGNWAVFYTADSNPFGITVLHAGSLNPRPFLELESEAVNRLARLNR